MKKIVTSVILSMLVVFTAHAQIWLNWQRFTDGTAHLDDSAFSIQIAGTEMLVGGTMNNAGTLNDAVIQKYDVNGNLVWSGVYASAFNDHINQVQCNGDFSEVYGAGNTDNGSYLIGLLVKMDINGNLLWSRTYSGSFAGDTKFLNVKVAPNGNIIVVGETQTALSVHKGIVASYDSAGNLLWKKTTGSTSGESQFNHVELDSIGNIYTSGFIYNGTDKDGYVAEYNKNGKLINSVTINGAGNKDDEVTGTEFMNGVLHAVTIGRGSGLYDEATITVYNPLDFSVIWSKNYSSVNGDVYIIGPDCNEITGDIMLAGMGNFEIGTSDYLALSYNATTGAQNWAKTISRGSGYNNMATAMTVDASGNLLITGSSTLAGATDIFTVAYDAAGNLLWSKVFNGVVNGDDYPTAMVADASGNIFVAGTSAEQISSALLPQGKYNLDFTLLKYSAKFICSVPTNLYSDSISSSFAWLHWDAMPEALKYKLQYRLVGGSWASINVTANNKIITGLTAKTKYQWRVKTICSLNPAVSSDYSVTKSFITLGTAFSDLSINKNSEAIAANQTGLQLLPNPAIKMVSLRLNGISETNMQVKIYDLSGKELQQYRFIAVNKTFDQQIDVSALSPGSYVVVVSGGKEKWTQILVKQ
jgi:hypothetical protein